MPVAWVRVRHYASASFIILLKAAVKSLDSDKALNPGKLLLNPGPERGRRILTAAAAEVQELACAQGACSRRHLTSPESIPAGTHQIGGVRCSRWLFGEAQWICASRIAQLDLSGIVDLLEKANFDVETTTKLSRYDARWATLVLLRSSHGRHDYYEGGVN